MNDNTRKWKDFLLKSSIPLEYELKQLLDTYGCVSNYDFTYLRPDEKEIVNQFSYDVDASYIKGAHFFELMIECKYRDLSTNWIFTPESYGGMDEIEHYSFINPNDHFTRSNKFLRLAYELYAPLCGKGIEITSDGQNPKSITQAMSQLSYAMAEKVISGMEHQIEETLGPTDVIFYGIPIIVTTANLYRLKENVTINDIKSSNEIIDVSTKEDCLIVKTPSGKHLQHYNLEKFASFIQKYGEDELNKRLNSFNADIDFVCSKIAKNYCPSSMAIIQFKEDNSGFNKLFDFLNEIIKPSETTLKKRKEEQEKLLVIRKDLERMKARNTIQNL